jgi:hypothetical protein
MCAAVCGNVTWWRSTVQPCLETREPSVWTLLRLILFFPMAVGVLSCLIAVIIYFAVKGLYSFDATGATLLTFFILCLSSPLIVSFASEVCFLRDRGRNLREDKESVNVRVQGRSSQQSRLRLIAGGRTDTVDRESAPFSGPKQGKRKRESEDNVIIGLPPPAC